MCLCCTAPALLIDAQASYQSCRKNNVLYCEMMLGHEGCYVCRLYILPCMISARLARLVEAAHVRRTGMYHCSLFYGLAVEYGVSQMYAMASRHFQHQQKLKSCMPNWHVNCATVANAVMSWHGAASSLPSYSCALRVYILSASYPSALPLLSLLSLGHELPLGRWLMGANSIHACCYSFYASIHAAAAACMHANACNPIDLLSLCMVWGGKDASLPISTCLCLFQLDNSFYAV